MRNINSSKLTKQFVLSKVSQITIMATYLNLSDKVVKNCIDKGELICSPIRVDEHPTCGFRYDNRGKLKFKDFSGVFWGDCFDVVAYVMSEMYNRQYDVSNKEDFIKILRHVTITFKDIFYGEEKDINLINSINVAINNIRNKKPVIELVIRDWNKQDEIYWAKFGVSIKTLNLNFIYPIDQFYINRKVNPEPKYYYNPTDPCYGYRLGVDRNGIYNIKLYFPKRTRNNTRFITNCNHLEGIYNLDRNDYDIIVLTKSTKDRVSIWEQVRRVLSLYGGENINYIGCNGKNNLRDIKIGVINIPHETYKLRQNEYDWLSGKCNSGIIISLMDNDRVGKREALWLKYNYNIIPILIPKYTECKDFAELVSKQPINVVDELIVTSIKKLLVYDKRKRNKHNEHKEE